MVREHNELAEEERNTRAETKRIREAQKEKERKV